MLALTFDVRPVRWAICRALGAFHPRVYWSRLSALRLCEVPIPELPGPDWVRLKTIYGGICGTDLMSILHRNHPATMLRAFSSFPAVLGHENASIIDQIGPAVGDFKPGERVCVEPSLSCVPRGIDPPCRACAAGTFSVCENVAGGSFPPGAIIGMNRFTGGSWGPYFVAHRSQLHRVPGTIDDRTAVLVDPIACGLHAVLRRRSSDDERVLIIGGGIIGLAVAASIRAMGCRARVTALVRREEQAERMSAYGADRALVTPSRAAHAERYDAVAADIGARRISILFGNQAFVGGYDVVYDCVGTGRSLTDAMKFTRARGTVVAVGTSQIGVVETTPLWFSELTVLGASGRQIEEFEGRRQHTYEIVFDLLRAGRLRLDGLLTHTFPISQYRSALRLLAGRSKHGVVKVAFEHRLG